MKYRVQAISSLHSCVNYVVKSLEDVAIEDLWCNTMDKRNYLLNIVVALCVVDIPESENSLIVNGGYGTTMFCHIC